MSVANSQQYPLFRIVPLRATNQKRLYRNNVFCTPEFSFPFVQSSVLKCFIMFSHNYYLFCALFVLLTLLLRWLLFLLPFFVCVLFYTKSVWSIQYTILCNTIDESPPIGTWLIIDNNTSSFTRKWIPTKGVRKWEKRINTSPKKWPKTCWKVGRSTNLSCRWLLPVSHLCQLSNPTLGVWDILPGTWEYFDGLPRVVWYFLH